MGYTTEQQWRAFENKMKNVLKAVPAANYLEGECKLTFDQADAWWKWGKEVLGGNETAYEVFDRWNGGWVSLSEAVFNNTLWDGYEEFLGHNEYWAD